MCISSIQLYIKCDDSALIGREPWIEPLEQIESTSNSRLPNFKKFPGLDIFLNFQAKTKQRVLKRCSGKLWQNLPQTRHTCRV